MFNVAGLGVFVPVECPSVSLAFCCVYAQKATCHDKILHDQVQKLCLSRTADGERASGAFGTVRTYTPEAGLIGNAPAESSKNRAVSQKDSSGETSIKQWTTTQGTKNIIS